MESDGRGGGRAEFGRNVRVDETIGNMRVRHVRYRQGEDEAGHENHAATRLAQAVTGAVIVGVDLGKVARCCNSVRFSGVLYSVPMMRMGGRDMGLSRMSSLYAHMLGMYRHRHEMQRNKNQQKLSCKPVHDDLSVKEHEGY